MAIVRQLDKRTNTTYVYESTSWWDSERKMSRSKRKLIGKVDPETGEVVPTDGRMRRAAERKAEKSASVDETVATDGVQAQIEALRAEVHELSERIEKLAELIGQAITAGDDSIQAMAPQPEEDELGQSVLESESNEA